MAIGPTWSIHCFFSAGSVSDTDEFAGSRTVRPSRSGVGDRNVTDWLDSCAV